MWTYELSTDDHEAVSFHMGYAKKKMTGSLPHKKKKLLKILQAAKNQLFVLKVMLCWLVVT